MGSAALRSANWIRDLAGVAVAATLLLWSAQAVLAAQPLCAEQGRMINGVWKLTCTGSCPGTNPPQNCPPLANGAGGPAGATYKFCKCPGEPESPCCHLVILDNPPPLPADPFETSGNCYAAQNCALTDQLCRKRRDPLTNQYNHACEDP